MVRERNHTPVLDMTWQPEEPHAPCLTVVQGAAVGQRYPLRGHLFRIGRGFRNDVVLLHPSISRSHAELRRDGNLFVLRDMGSTNGTFVGDVRVGTRVLGDGEVVRVGPVALRFLSGSGRETEYNDEMCRAATTDFLTGALGRRAFEQTLATEIARALRHGRALSLLVLDVDGFKQINDRYGHATGDETLRALCGVLCRNLRRADVLARLGGDEFAVVLPETDGRGARRLGEKLRACIEQASLPSGAVGDTGVKTTISIGVTSFVSAAAGGAAMTADDFMVLADSLLYEAKHAGRNRVASRGNGHSARISIR